jgi:nucleotide-binding universal stress UspA family protein
MTAKNRDMTSQRITGGAIVVGVDGSPSSEHAVTWAAEEAGLRHQDLTLVHAQKRIAADELAWLASAGIPSRQVNEQVRADAEAVVERARALAADRTPGLPIETVVADQDARRLLLDVGSGAEMTVVGTRGHGRVVGLLLGSVSSALVRHSQRPVAVVRPVAERGRGVLVGADGSEESVELVEYAYREASLHQMPLTVVHCLWDGMLEQARWTTVSETDPVAEQALLRISESMAGMDEKFPDVSTEVLVSRGAIDACLVDLSARYDLLVIGRPVRPLMLRLTMSSLTTPVVEHAHSPVLVVP